MTDPLRNIPNPNAWAALSERLAAEHDRNVQKAVGTVHAMTGTGSRYRNGVIVSASAFEQLRALAKYPNDPPSRFWRSSPAIFDIPIYVGADWTFNPSTVATARLIAALSRPFRVIVRHLALLGPR